MSIEAHGNLSWVALTGSGPCCLILCLRIKLLNFQNIQIVHTTQSQSLKQPHQKTGMEFPLWRSGFMIQLLSLEATCVSLSPGTVGKDPAWLQL